MQRDDCIYIEHILESVDKIFRYTSSITVHNFVENDMIQDAAIRNVEVIGKASKRI